MPLVETVFGGLDRAWARQMNGTAMCNLPVTPCTFNGLIDEVAFPLSAVAEPVAGECARAIDFLARLLGRTRFLGGCFWAPLPRASAPLAGAVAFSGRALFWFIGTEEVGEP